MVKKAGSKYPKIGIRPTIDGRRKGVRESLEQQTMNLAAAAAKLISTNLKNPDGSAVECVIADTCIGGVAEAAMAADKFAREGVGVSLTVTPCWCYGSETMDMDPHMPKAIWGFNGTERPGAVYLAAVLAAHNQKGLPAFGIYGMDVKDAGDTTIPDDVREKLLGFARAGMAAAYMKGKSYLSMGSVSMGIAGSIVNENFFQEYLGMRNEYVDMSEFIRRIDEGIYDKDEFAAAKKWVGRNCVEGSDNNPAAIQLSRAQKDKNWDFVIKMAMIARDMMRGNPALAKIGYVEESMGHNAIAGGFQGQRSWTDHFPNGDFMEAILNSSFDWNGIREALVVATENDSLNGTAMLFGHLLTNTAQVFADVRTYWSPEAVLRVTGSKLTGMAENGIIHLINSGAAALDGTGEQRIGQEPAAQEQNKKRNPGAGKGDTAKGGKAGAPVMKPFWEITDDEVAKCLNATKWVAANVEYFRGGGYSSMFKTRGGMPVTMSRINLVKGLGPVIQIAEGYTADIPDKIHDVLNKRTDPGWPTTWFVPVLTGKGAFKDVYSVMANWGANHSAFCYGHVGADMITLASILRIPVCMHNVSDDKIFRPSAWSAFGTSDLEGADYRACSNFGPLYG